MLLQAHVWCCPHLNPPIRPGAAPPRGAAAARCSARPARRRGRTRRYHDGTSGRNGHRLERSSASSTGSGKPPSQTHLYLIHFFNVCFQINDGRSISYPSYPMTSHPFFKFLLPNKWWSLAYLIHPSYPMKIATIMSTYISIYYHHHQRCSLNLSFPPIWNNPVGDLCWWKKPMTSQLNLPTHLPSCMARCDNSIKPMDIKAAKAQSWGVFWGRKHRATDKKNKSTHIKSQKSFWCVYIYICYIYIYTSCNVWFFRCIMYR